MTTPLGFEGARHLLARAGFGDGHARIVQLAGLDAAQAVQRLLDEARTQSWTALPDWVGEPPPVRARGGERRKALQQLRRERGLELKAWWLREMLRTPSPLTERMTLFWHDHFTSSLRKVKWPGFVAAQHVLLRRHALGSFADLLRDIVRDPAMLLYLDNHRSRRDAPNENLARELLELFTLGEGQGYGEDDVKAAARALTGYGVDRASGTFRMRRRDHDDGEKTFLGTTGRLDGDDLIEILLAQPRTAEHIATKLWCELVSQPPDAATLARLADDLRASDYQLAPLLTAILTSDAFLDPGERGRIVRSPVHLVVGTLRTLGLRELELEDCAPLARLCRQLGQDLFDPPNVEGWPGGNRWLSASTLLRRQQALRRAAGHAAVARRLASHGGLASAVGAEAATAADDPEAARTLARSVLLPLEPVQPQPAAHELGDALAALLLDPVGQLC